MDSGLLIVMMALALAPLVLYFSLFTRAQTRFGKISRRQKQQRALLAFLGDLSFAITTAAFGLWHMAAAILLGGLIVGVFAYIRNRRQEGF